MSGRLLILLVIPASAGVVASDDHGEEVRRSVIEAEDYYCSSTNFTDGSQYEKNLNDLVSTLSTAAAVSGSGWFHSGSVGTAPGDQAWGLIMCYADTDVTQCLDCLREASLGDLRAKSCPHGRNMSVNYGGCLLRYADASFLGTADVGWTVTVPPLPPVEGTDDDVASLNETRWQLLNRFAESVGDEPLRFLSGSQTYRDVRGALQVVYGLSQCTRDLVPSECTRCLKYLLRAVTSDEMVNRTRDSIQGFSCYTRFQVNDPIHIIAGLEPAPAPAPVPGQSTQPSEAASPPGSKSSKTPVIAALTAAVAVALSVAGA